MDDWEIVELNAQYLEDQLLNQIAVVRKDLVLPIWIKQKIKVMFKVGVCLYGYWICMRALYDYEVDILIFIVSIFPENEFVVIGSGTEVAISPKQREKNIIHNKEEVCELKNLDIDDIYLNLHLFIYLLFVETNRKEKIKNSPNTKC
jgi:hypothetical protein